MNIPHLLIFILLPFFFTIPIQSSPSPPHFLKSTTNHSPNTTTHPQRYFELTHPLPTDAISPACSVGLLNHSFANTYAIPPVTVHYTPPPATCQWSTAVIDFQARCKGDQYDRIAGVWIGGVEVLRTSTAQPTEDGIVWNVRKDVSRYESIISQSDDLTITVMLENLVNDEFTGVYHVSISLLFYSDVAVRFPFPLLSIVPPEAEAKSLNRKLVSVKNHAIGDKLDINRALNSLDQFVNSDVGVRVPLSIDFVESEAKSENHAIGDKLGSNRALKLLNPFDKPADLILPISASNGVDEGFWFRIQDEFDVKTKAVLISNKTYKAVLELYVSFHGNDEFWYMNPSDLYVETNHLSTGRAHGAYREVLVTIDGRVVSGVVPFPVIFTGGINPLFWEPVVSIGAFDLPSYNIDLTPFLGLLLDDKSHSITIQIADGISFWLVDANLHLWLDQSTVRAETLKTNIPFMNIQRKSEFEMLDGEFEIEGEREIESTGWVRSSSGNLQTQITEKTKFKNKLKFTDQGTKKELRHQYKRRTKIRVTNEMGQLIESLEVKINYPLKVSIETKPGSEIDTSVMTTTVEQERNEKLYGEKDFMTLSHKQNCTGLMVVKGSAVLSGSAENHQNYNYKDGAGCYSRMVDVVDGDVVWDDSSSVCAV